MPKKIIDIFPPTSTKAFREKIFSLPYKTKNFWNFEKKIIVIIIFLFSIAFYLLNFIFSEVRIEIWPKTEFFDSSSQEEIILIADSEKKNIDDLVLSRTIPAEIIDTGEITKDQSFPSSGRTSKESKAQGKIKVFNNYHLSQSLVVNTRFQAPSEENIIYFRSTKSVTVPAKGSLEIDVVADRPGQEYNIEPATFSIPGLVGLAQYSSIYGKSFSSMTGGFKGDIMKVEKEDLERAKNVLAQDLFSEARKHLQNKTGNDFILLNDVIKEEILETSSSAEAGSEAEHFKFAVKVKASALVFKRADMENFVKEFILSQTAGGKKIQESSLKISYSQKSINLNIGKIELKLDISLNIYSDIDVVLLKEKLKNKSLNEAQAILENQEQVNKVQIVSFPPWVKNIPDNSEKIKINLTID